MRKFGVALAALPLLLVGCGGPTSGYVSDLEHQPAHTRIEQEPIYIQVCRYDQNLKMTTCQPQLAGFRDVERAVPECYYVEFRDEEGDKGDDCVSQSKFETLSAGDWYEVSNS